MGRALLGAQILLALFVAAFAASRSLPLSLLLIFIAGICSMAVFSMRFSLVQLTVPDDLRGRIVQHLHGRAAQRLADRRPGRRGFARSVHGAAS